MATQKKGNIVYERDKNKIKITGNSEDVKAPILLDLICKEMRWLILVGISVFLLPKANFLPLLLKWFKEQLTSLILFLVVANSVQLLLSG